MEEFNPLDFGVSPARAISRFGEFDSLLLPEEHFIKRKKKKNHKKSVSVHNGQQIFQSAEKLGVLKQIGKKNKIKGEILIPITYYPFALIH